MEFRKVVVAILVIAFIVGGCATPPEVDWQLRRAELDMRLSEVPGVIGYLTVAGNIDAYTFTEGALWIVVAAPTKRWLPVNRLAKINLHTNRFVDLYAVDGFAGAALASGYGSIWLAEGLGGEMLHRIDPNTDQIIASIALPRNPIAVAAGEGGVWVLAAKSVSKFGKILISVDGLALYKIDPTNNTITGVIKLPITKKSAWFELGSRIYIIDGSIWLSIQDGTILRIDPQTNKVLATIHGHQEAIVGIPSYGRNSNEEKSRIKQATAILDRPVYAVAVGMGTLWAFTHRSKTDSDSERITWIMRLHP